MSKSLFTVYELEYSNRKTEPLQTLTGIFCSKEAFIKAISGLNEPGRVNTSKSYLWVHRGGGEKPRVVFDYQQTRSGYHVQNFIENFKGYLQTDAYSGYSFTAISN